MLARKPAIFAGFLHFSPFFSLFQKPDFISKLQIALKEANETGYWLELLYKTDYIDGQTYKSLDTACASIRVMLVASSNTSKENK